MTYSVAVIFIQYPKPGPLGKIKDHCSALRNQSSKSEARNPKQCLMTKIPMIETVAISDSVKKDCFGHLGV